MKTWILIGAAALLAFSGCAGASDAPAAQLVVGLDEIGRNFDTPVFATTAGGERIFIVEQAGRIMVLEDRSPRPTPFLDIRDRVGSGGERGLLGLAFDPEYATNDRFYVHYNDKNGDTVLSVFLATDDVRADAGFERVLLRQEQPYGNHNGGMIAFHEGFLFMGLGDGGSSGDPHGNGQKLTTVLGKLLRLDVSGDTATCPASNPNLGEGSRCEIWSYGLRNPWRFSFDSETGDIFIGDVGQNKWEEVNFSPASSRGGENYGWNVFEGSHPFRSGNVATHTKPISEYPTGPGGTCAVTGGYVYRGSAIGSLGGRYVFGDYCSGTIWILERQGSSWERLVLLETPLNISSFGEDAAGEILVVDRGGSIHRLVQG